MDRPRGLELLLLGLVVFLSPRWIDSNYYYNVMIFVAINAVLTISLNLLLGYAGQVSLGHAGFYGLGAYTAGILSARWGVHPLPASAIGVALTAGVAFVIGFPCLKLQGYYLAMATLGFGFIFYILFNELDFLSGGPTGLMGIPVLSVGGFAFNSDARYYYLAWTVVLLTMALAFNLIDSRIGKALRALGCSEIGATSVGVDTARYKLQVFVLSASLAAVAGCLYTYYITFLSPSTFDFMVSVELVVMVIVGGIRSIWGSLLGAAFLTLLPEYLRAYQEYDVLIHGALLIVVLMVMPQGIAGSLGWARRRVTAGRWASGSNPRPPTQTPGNDHPLAG